jgi:cold-inducible RNA-binding protein
MGTKLYVGNLSYATNEETLRAVFGEGGRQVRSVSIIIDRETGRSRGFGFVQMASPEEAQAAMAALDGFEVEGRPLRVKEAREREAGGREGAPREGGPREGGPREGGPREGGPREGGPREGGPRRMDNRVGALPPRGNPRERTGPREQEPERERRPEPRDVRPSGGDGPPRPGFGGFAGGSFEDREKAARGRSRGNQKRRGGAERERGGGDDDSDSRRGRGRGRDRDWRRDWDL